MAQMLSELPVGGVSRPVPVPGGFSILRLVERRADGSASVDATDPQLREQVRRRLMAQRSGLLSEGLLQELRRQWGNLPPRAREEILQGATEEMHDAFREQIFKYYEALSKRREEDR